MDLATVTIDDFQSQFRRDFPFLPLYDADTTYFKGDVVYSNNQFWECQVDDTLGSSPAAAPTKWKRVPQDVDNYVGDEDITRAFGEAEVSLNQEIFGDDATIRLAYLYLTAHYMVMDIRTARAGVNSTGEGFQTGRSVGSVSVSSQLPQDFINDPVLGYFYKSGYGQKYLSFLIPRLRGNIGVVAGWTQP